MRAETPTDYETYRQIMNDLLAPIAGDDLASDTLKRLYESKLVYLQNLRTKCFFAINAEKQAHFTMQDYCLIMEALHSTRSHLRQLILSSLADAGHKRAAHPK